MAVAQKMYQNGTLVDGTKDKNMRNPGSLILTHVVGGEVPAFWRAFEQFHRSGHNDLQVLDFWLIPKPSGAQQLAILVSLVRDRLPTHFNQRSLATQFPLIFGQKESLRMVKSPLDCCCWVHFFVIKPKGFLFLNMVSGQVGRRFPRNPI